ncbi:MAG: hypothetical protein IJK31_06990 [Ruminococcus sp.]|nr:hypothetical protein [Ruminococcus sp.]
MSTNNENGRKICIGIGVYLIAKCVLNMIIGGGLDISGLLIAAGLSCVLWLGIQYTNYAVAGILALIALVHLPANISNISSNWIYLIEGIIDIGFAALLCIHSDIKEHFTNTLNINN